jgi:hypothetical protein
LIPTGGTAIIGCLFPSLISGPEFDQKKGVPERWPIISEKHQSFFQELITS